MKTAINDIVNLLGDGFGGCKSPSLRLEKFVSITPDNQTERKQELEGLLKCYSQNATPAKNFSVQPAKSIQIEAYLLSNLVVNQSGGVLENAGLCLDRLHGYPYIPGSAVKGIASHAAYQVWKDAPTDELATAIVDVFGFPTGHKELDEWLRSAKKWSKDIAFAGHVCFLAAVPNSSPYTHKCELTLDIATSHHPAYYQGKQDQATDDEAPIPILFPAVKAGAEFVFRIAPLRNVTEATLANAKKWLENALTVFGAGAKTAAGMGWFELGRSPEARTKEQSAQQLRDLQNAKKIAAEKKAEEAEAARKAQQEKHAIEVAAQNKIKADEANGTPFSSISGNWSKVSHKVTEIYKNSGGFTQARQEELFKALLVNDRVKLSDLNGGKKSLVKWLGEELAQRLLQEKDAK